jgi:hypothetical protein
MTIEIFQIAALRAMEALWKEGIRDTQDEEPGDIWRITQLYRAIGWQWYLDEYGVNGEYVEHNEEKEHTMKWCGVGIANAYLSAHRFMPFTERRLLIPAVASIVMPSTFRIQDAKSYAKASKEAKRIIPMMDQIDPRHMRPGDIVTTGHKSYGTHFRMCAEPPALITKKWRSIEANGTGEFPDGTRGEGVVRNTVRLDEVRRVYRVGYAHTCPIPVTKAWRPERS